MNSILEQVRLGRPVDIDGIDMHAHLGRYKFAVPDTSAQAMVDSMDRLGIRSTACSLMGASGPYVDEGNAYVLAAMRAHPGRILGYVGLFPSTSDEVRKVTERWLAEGFIGLKVHNSNRIP